MVAEQDDNLGMLSSTMTRLGQMGLAIKALTLTLTLALTLTLP